MSINLSPVSSGPLRILPAIAAPNTQVTVTLQNLKMGTKVALSAVLYGATYMRPDIVAKDLTQPVGQDNGTANRANMLAAQKVFYHTVKTDRTYRTGFSGRNTITGLQDGAPGNPTVSFVMPFANAVQYYKLDSKLYRLVRAGVISIISAVVS